MANPDLLPGALLKPAKGSGIIAREAAKAEREKEEREAIAAAKLRDGYKCRWPEKHKCRGLLEGAHIDNKSQCGLNTPENIVSVCAWLHRRGPESIHGQQLKVEKDTADGARGPLSFWRQTGEYDALGQPMYYLVARERSAGVIEHD